MLKLQHVHKDYLLKNSKVIALDSISLQFPETGVVAILGPSGCGKTTMMNIIGGMDRDFQGDVIVHNESLSHMSETEVDTYRKRRIGFIFQHAAVVNSLTVLENVTLAMAMSGEDKPIQIKRAMDLLKTLEIPGLAKRKINTLSGGQKQRVIIARALANDPEIILADEPTGELDTKNSTAILNLLRKLGQQRLILMVTHEEQFARDYADRIIRMKDGQVVTDEGNIPLPQEVLDTQWTPIKNKHTRSRLHFLDAVHIAYRSLMIKKGRTFWTSFGTAVGLIGIGLTLSITIGFSNLLKRELFSNFDVYGIDVSPKYTQGTYSEYSPTESQLGTLLGTVQGEERVTFHHYLTTSYNTGVSTTTVPGYGTLAYPSIDHVAHFYPIEYIENELQDATFWPSEPTTMTNSEVILGIDIESPNVQDLCGAYEISTCSIESLGETIALGGPLVMEIDYVDSNADITFNTTLNIVAVTSIPTYDFWNTGMAFIHTNPEWNTILFEGQDIAISPYGGYSDGMEWGEQTLVYFKNDFESIMDSWVQNDDFLKYHFQLIDMTASSDNIHSNVIQVTIGEAPRFTLTSANNLIESHADSIIGYAFCTESVISCGFGMGNMGFSYSFPFVVSTSEEKNMSSLGIIDDYEMEVDGVITSSSIGFKPYDATRPELSKRLFPVQGELAASDAYDSLVISEAMAMEINKDDPFSLIGETIIFTGVDPETIRTEDALPRYVSFPFTVTGILPGEESITVYQDSSWSYFVGTEVFGFKPYQMTSSRIHLSVYDTEQMNELLDQLPLQFESYDFTNFFIEIVNVFEQIISGVRYVLISLSSISVLVAILMVAIVTYLAVVERTREIGIIRAMGGRRADIRNLFLIESWVIGVFAAILALSVVFLISQGINLVVTGIVSMSNPENAEFIMVAEVEWMTISTIIGSAFMLSILAGLAPAHQASKLDPIKALKKR